MMRAQAERGQASPIPNLDLVRRRLRLHDFYVNDEGLLIIKNWSIYTANNSFRQVYAALTPRLLAWRRKPRSVSPVGSLLVLVSYLSSSTAPTLRRRASLHAVFKVSYYCTCEPGQSSRGRSSRGRCPFVRMGTFLGLDIVYGARLSSQGRSAK